MNMIKQTSGVWRVDFTDSQGARKRLSTGSKDALGARCRAKDLIDQHEARLEGAKPPEAAKRGLRVDALLDRCLREVWNTAKSFRTAKSIVRILKGYVGGELVTDMTFTRLDKLRLEMSENGYAPATVKRKITALGKALTMATMWTDENGRPLLASKPAMPKIPVENFRDRIISPVEMEAIFAAAAARTKAEPMRDWKRFSMLMTFLRDTGCRLGEALNLTIADLRESQEGQQGAVVYAEFARYTTKNKKPRSVPLSPAIVENLPYLRAASNEGKLFPFVPGTAWYSFDTLRKDVCATGINIDDIVLHTFRHTCLTRLARTGKVRIENIADWAGHSNVQVTIDRYRHMLPEDKLETLAALLG